ncbi:MAG: c-type cytochrome [Gemmataceae bacterium]
MAASDQHYRNQATLDIIFGAGCVLLLLATVWAFVQDYYRPFKSVQRKFRQVEATIAERELVARLPDSDQLREKRIVLRQAREAVEDARAAVILGESQVLDYRSLLRSKEGRNTTEGAQARRELARGVAAFEAKERGLKAQLNKADETYRTIKADLDSKISLYNIEVDEAGRFPAESPDGRNHRERANRFKADVESLETQLGRAQEELDRVQAVIQKEIRKVVEGPEKALAAAEDEMKKLAGASDRFAKLASQKAWSTGDSFRALPIIDGFESPTKIRQIWLPELTIDYGGFRDVPRFDRCTTCHLGIDRSAFDPETLARLGDKRESDRLTSKLALAKTELEKRAAAGENLGFSPDDLPGESGGSVALVTGILFLCVLVAALSLGILQQSLRLGMITLLAGLVVTLGTSGTLAWWAPRVTRVQTIDLQGSEVAQYAAHPRLDLFVDSNSPHPMEKFGCTVCHAGQGSATDFGLASHTPNDGLQIDQWKKEYLYHPSHFWDFPMLQKRFVEASCLKCHHEVTDLVREGKEEAPKLLKGYTLVKEYGCFGCHEIQGQKGGRRVGPDMRLEPSPALDWLSAADQDRARSDPSAPPGTYRKVGPSLRRLSEKVGHDWTVQWITNPRGFRPDTKMPHFYNLSTNNKAFLAGDDARQENFPAAEIQAISHYLIQESNNSLEARDSYRQGLLVRRRNLLELQKNLVQAGLSERDYKELLDLSRRFVDLALLSSPRNSNGINSLGARQRQLQERLAELHRRGGDAESSKVELEAAGKELTTVTDALIQLGKPTPLSAGLVNDSGDTVALPQGEGNLVNGRVLFTEKGCLACHAHGGTSSALQKDGKTVAGGLTSAADFGPELSRIADKLDASRGRRWLVQWLLNPNIYHPRTRMPVTHLTVDQANDIAAWLLSQKTGWKGEPTDPKEPSVEDYKALARVYLAKAPSITRLDLEEILPATGTDLPGISPERLQSFARDADEHALARGAVNVERLKWYIGRKAIGRLGCYGCHDIPGFETAKPIGTGLNDWGKKEGERLAFEDGEAFVRNHFNLVPSRVTRAEVVERLKQLEEKPAEDRSKSEVKELDRLKKQMDAQKRIEELEKQSQERSLTEKEEAELESLRPFKFFELTRTRDGQVKEPFETSFYHSLEHHQREGFLHLKLVEPRAYDYKRIRSWDDRLRMPQFRFTRLRKLAEETDEAFQARQDKAESEAREAVMTFILGLVAEPMPPRYVHNPTPEKKAEIVGRQVLEKYNCAGCHEIRPGSFDFKPLDTQAMLDRSYSLAAGDNGRNFLNDHAYQGHNAWFGTNPTGGQLRALGYRDARVTQQAQDLEGLGGTVAIRLVEALRFQGGDRLMRDMPAGTYLYLPQGSFRESPGYGGAWTELMVGYLAKKDSTKFPAADPGKARTVLPPPLQREGERVQPDWLYKFLLNPHPVRPQFPESTAGLLLQMPRFNLSPEESRAVVNYFAAVSKMGNPGAGVTAPYVYIDQRNPDYWRRAITGYEQSLRTMLASAHKEAVAAKGDATKEKAWQARVKLIQEALKPNAGATKPGQASDQYSRSAFRLVTHKDLCLKCHAIGNVKIEGAQGPNLALAAERLRPEWTEQWIAQPLRMFSYPPVMPQNFPNNADPLQWTYQEAFVGTPLQQTRAVRDLIMDLPRLNDLLQTIPPATKAPGGSK